MGAEPHTLFFTGYARLPSGITASEMGKIVGLGLEIDATTREIVTADCTLATTVGRDFVRRLLVGWRLDADLDHLIHCIEARYHGNAQKALIAALRAAHEKFCAYRAGH